VLRPDGAMIGIFFAYDCFNASNRVDEYSCRSQLPALPLSNTTR
jgi:hypothetical protein